MQISFDRSLLDAVQDSPRFTCLFSSGNDTHSAEVHQSENGTFYLFGWAAGDNDDSNIVTTDDREEAENHASEAIEHQSYNWDYEGYEGEGEEPEKTDASFKIYINTLLSAEQVELLTVTSE